MFTISCTVVMQKFTVILKVLTHRELLKVLTYRELPKVPLNGLEYKVLTHAVDQRQWIVDRRPSTREPDVKIRLHAPSRYA